MEIRKWQLWIPLIGMGAYLVLFTSAAALYPGGSINQPTATGYSFFHNFLCDLFAEDFPSKGNNPARSIAIIAHVTLGITMMAFFYVLPGIFETKNKNTKMIQIFGLITMGVFCFMFTPLHDSIVISTAVLGTFALVPFFIELRKFTHIPLKTLALVCYGMSVIVFTMYTTKWGIYYLPFLQKLTFILDAVWVVWVSVRQIKQIKHASLRRAMAMSRAA